MGEREREREGERECQVKWVTVTHVPILKFIDFNLGRQQEQHIQFSV
jgi:hypothetical protein